MLLILAWRNLWRHRTRSLAIIFSVVLGIWAGAFLVALYYGMGRDRMRIAIREEVSHVQVHHPGFADDQDAAFHFSVDSLAVAVKEVPDLRAYSCRCVAQAMLANASGSNGVMLYGVDPEAENATRGFRDMVVQGGYLTNEKPHQLMIGLKLARKMKLNAGAKVVITFLDAQQNIVSAAFRITGIFESSNTMLDERNVYVRYDELSALMGIEGRAHEVALLLTTDAAVPNTVEALQQKLPQLLIEDWKTISPETAYIISAVGASSRIILIIIFLALGFGIVNTMLMAVLERTREIGMLMAVGMGKGRVFAMVLLETLLLTLAGTPIGVGFSLLTVSWLSKTGIDLSRVAGNMMKGFGLEAVLYPWLPVQQLGEIIAIVIITALIAAIFPAWKALALKPAEAIRR